jgi:guanylate kinase
VDYFFVDRNAFVAERDAGGFLEHAEFGGNLYGTSRRAVDSVLGAGRVCVLDVDVRGVQALAASTLRPARIFISPPSVDALEARLRSRGTESEDSIRKRMAEVRESMAYAELPDSYDAVIVNDDVERAYADLLAALGRLQLLPSSAASAANSSTK